MHERDLLGSFRCHAQPLMLPRAVLRTCFLAFFITVRALFPSPNNTDSIKSRAVVKFSFMGSSDEFARQVVRILCIVYTH